MTPQLQFDQLHIISDLHFGGQPGFQIFGSQAEMLWFINDLASRPAEHQIGLVINGDFIDFLAEHPQRHFDPEFALAKLKRIALDDPTFAPIFAALRDFLRAPGRSLLLNLGNHDLELALPWVQTYLISLLSNDDPVLRARLHVVFDGSGMLTSVGGKAVLCVHGNEVDAFNPADFETIRQIGRDVQFGKPAKDWIPNAGSVMVIDIMNKIKETYPFVDLLKPEIKAVIPILLACDPSQLSKMDNVFGLAGFGNQLLRTTVIRAGMLGEEMPPGVVPSPPPSNFGLTTAMLAAQFQSPPAAATSDAETMMRMAEQQIQAQSRPQDLLPGELADANLGAVQAFFEWLRGRQTVDVLREALEMLDKDACFDPFVSDPTFTDLDEKIGAGIDFLVAGHTHLERAKVRNNGGGAYFNSGTWARLIKVEPAVRNDPVQFKQLFNILKNGNMTTLDATPGLIQKRCSIVAIEKSAGGVFGELRHVVARGAGFDYETVAGSRLPRS